MSYTKTDIEIIINELMENHFLLRKRPLDHGVMEEDYVPEEPNFPNACRYAIETEPDENGMRESHLIEDLELKEFIVKRLKEIHGIVDPWDKEPEVYTEKWRKAHESRPKLSQEEWERARQVEIAAAFAEERTRKERR